MQRIAHQSTERSQPGRQPTRTSRPRQRAEALRTVMPAVAGPGLGVGDHLPRRAAGAVPLVALAVYAVVVLRTSWLSDDSYITLRTIDNLLNGYGLTWNVAERVQTYTHPLWLLVLTPLITLTREVFYTTQLLSFVISVTAMGLLAGWVARGPATGVFVVAIAVSSRSLVDYSTSGLENPLSHLLLVLVALGAIGVAGRPTWGATLLPVATGLLVLNRADLVWLVAPIMLAHLVNTPGWRRRLNTVVIAGLPLGLWTLFSLIYYGFPWPNTAYAKLGTGIPLREMIEQGLLYLVNSLIQDPITLTAIVAALCLSLTVSRRTHWPLGLGIIAQLTYVVMIGGDFMSGRFLSAPLMLALVALARADLPAGAASIGAAVALLLGLLSPAPPLLSNAEVGRGRAVDPDPNGVTDERAYYYPASGLLVARRGADIHPEHGWAREGRLARQASSPLEVRGTVGFFGYFAGPRVHLLDTFALGDPLLARLPATPNLHWRPGHFDRPVPRGYAQTLTSGRNLIEDPVLRRYYDELALVIRGPIWSAERFAAIWRINVGSTAALLALYDPLMTLAPDPPTGQRMVALTTVSSYKRTNTAWDAPGVTLFSADGLRIDLGERRSATALEVSLDHNDAYRIVFADSELRRAEVTVGPRLGAGAGLAVYPVSVPLAASTAGYTQVVVIPVTGDGAYSLGHLRLLD